MDPITDERLAGSRLRLGDFIGVVRKNEISATGVDINSRAEDLH